MKVYVEDTKDDLVKRWKLVPKSIADSLKDLYVEKGAIISIYNNTGQLIGLLGLLGMFKFTEYAANIHYINIFASRKLIIHYFWIAEHVDNRSIIADELVNTLIKYTTENGLGDRPIICICYKDDYLPILTDKGFVKREQCLIRIKNGGV